MKRLTSHLLVLILAFASAEVTFIAGASRGLGLELARSFAAVSAPRGKNPTVHATTRSRVQQPGALGSIPGVRVYSLDVANATQVAGMSRAYNAEGGAIDLLVHNAGINNGTLERQMEVNAIAPFRLVQALMPALLRSTGRRVCIVTSDRGQQKYVRKFQARFSGTSRHGGGRLCKDVGYCAYAVSKGAAHDTFRRLEPRWRAQGIVAAVIHPGGLATDMNGGLERCRAFHAARKNTGSECISAAQRAPDVQRLCASLQPQHAGKLLNWKAEVMPW